MISAKKRRWVSCSVGIQDFPFQLGGAKAFVPVVVEIILERVTNIAMGTEIDNLTEFEDVLDLPPGIDVALEDALA